MLALAYQPSSLLWLIPVGALYLAALANGLKALHRRQALFWLVAALLVLPLAMQLLVSVRRPLFGERTLFWWQAGLLRGKKRWRPRWVEKITLHQTARSPLCPDRQHNCNIFCRQWPFSFLLRPLCWVPPTTIAT
jgi:hypothetical protein